MEKLVTVTADLSEDSTKRLRHEMLWRDFLSKVRYISKNPKYKEIGLYVGIPGYDEGGVPSESQSQPT